MSDKPKPTGSGPLGQSGIKPSSTPEKSYYREFVGVRDTNTHAEQRRNAIWFHATTKGLFDPAQQRIRPYTVDELATLWAVTPEVVRQGIAEAEKINAKLTETRA